MHRFYLPPEECRGDQLLLADREAHHALRVLRVRMGEKVAVHDGSGHIFSCKVAGLAPDTVSLMVEEKTTVPPLPCAVTLIQAIPKAKVIESIIQKATELGAARIIPLLSERVVTQVDSHSAAQKSAKWQQVAIEAIKQSGNAWLPKVETPVTPAVLLQRPNPYDLALIGSLQDGSRHPREHIETFARIENRPPRSICVWVGPEGDFTGEEYQAIEAAGALPITLGRLILRSETAATYCLAVLAYEMQWMARD